MKKQIDNQEQPKEAITAKDVKVLFTDYLDTWGKEIYDLATKEINAIKKKIKAQVPITFKKDISLSLSKTILHNHIGQRFRSLKTTLEKAREASEQELLKTVINTVRKIVIFTCSFPEAEQNTLTFAENNKKNNFMIEDLVENLGGNKTAIRTFLMSGTRTINTKIIHILLHNHPKIAKELISKCITLQDLMKQKGDDHEIIKASNAETILRYLNDRIYDSKVKDISPAIEIINKHPEDFTILGEIFQESLQKYQAGETNISSFVILTDKTLKEKEEEIMQDLQKLKQFKNKVCREAARTKSVPDLGYYRNSQNDPVNKIKNHLYSFRTRLEEVQDFINRDPSSAQKYLETLQKIQKDITNFKVKNVDPEDQTFDSEFNELEQTTIETLNKLNYPEITDLISDICYFLSSETNKSYNPTLKKNDPILNKFNKILAYIDQYEITPMRMKIAKFDLSNLLKKIKNKNKYSFIEEKITETLEILET